MVIEGADGAVALQVAVAVKLSRQHLQQFLSIWEATVGVLVREHSRHKVTSSNSTFMWTDTALKLLKLAVEGAKEA